MTDQQIRQKFFDFFKQHGHQIVPSAPIVIKDDPTLMFTNAGMNQFKDVFLGAREPENKRVADTQKCLRVSGKHNDLEEVGHDTYHHTMFEMLGNWSFGDYFKAGAIEMAWKFLTEELNIDKDKLYVTIFAGDPLDSLTEDEESFEIWSKYIDPSRILKFGKKDNFWEMGEVGPSGPCSEIHIDIRPEKERKKVDADTLVNTGHPGVIELWNLVFIQYLRKVNRSLESLPEKHVDTGMGLERLCMVIEGKQSNYDTSVFSKIISSIEQISGKTYNENEKTDIAIRVIADHIRALCFTIADGQLPSNTGAGYVIRRILRRAVRYGVSYLNLDDPFLYQLIPTVAEHFKPVFPELLEQINFLQKVIHEEENAFIKTLKAGLKRLENIKDNLKGKVIPGKEVFELYDTYGFPVDLTGLIAGEQGLKIDQKGFEFEMELQKERSRKAAAIELSEWVILAQFQEVEFVGYDQLSCEAKVLRYRKVKQKNREFYQVILDKTPFYAESGGQVGDQGWIRFEGKEIKVFNTIKILDVIVHLTEELPEILPYSLTAEVDAEKRRNTTSNHSATHLMHAALRQVLGNHVEQKGSYVGPDHLRFDFAHFEKMSEEEIEKVERLVNQKIWENVERIEQREVPIDEALAQGIVALFGEKYGEKVRVITFDEQFSKELCGGTHVTHTGQISVFKILHESAIAAGVRRIEAVTGEVAFNFFQDNLHQLYHIGDLTKNRKDIIKSVENLVIENQRLKEDVNRLSVFQNKVLVEELKQKVQKLSGVQFISDIVHVNSANDLKDISFKLRNELNDIFVVLAANISGKPLISIMIADNLVDKFDLNAGKMIREAAKHIKGGGGGQPFYATAGGKDVNGIDEALKSVRQILERTV
jgi:alanyl-tRNA synthetase